MSARILSVRQPWAWAMFHAGMCVANKPWEACAYRGPVVVYASSKCTRAEYAAAVSLMSHMRRDIGAPFSEVPALEDLVRGALVGLARVVRADLHPLQGVVRRADGEALDWGRGHVGYRISGDLGLQLDDVVELPPEELGEVLTKEFSRAYLRDGAGLLNVYGRLPGGFGRAA